MPKKPYKFTEDTPITANEPTVAYDYKVAEGEVSSSEKWNPNVPFHCTQEEFLERIRSIEQGKFYPVADAHQRVSEWLSNQKR